MDKNSKVLDEEKKVVKKRRNILIFTLTTQLIVCIVIVFGLFLTKIFFKTQYSSVIKKINYALKDNSLKNFFNDFLNKLKQENKNLKNNENSVEQEKEKINNKIEKETEKQKQQENVNLKNIEESFNSLCSANDDDVTFFTFMQPLEGKITSKYGKRENPVLKGAQDFHYGVDILAKDNTPVVSIADGVVNLTASSKKSGNYVSIKHGKTYESLYAHCNKILVKKGSFVKKGEKIALSGHTGNITGAHLHLGIKKDGNWINPSFVLPNLI